MVPFDYFSETEEKSIDLEFCELTKIKGNEPRISANIPWWMFNGVWKNIFECNFNTISSQNLFDAWKIQKHPEAFFIHQD